MTHAERFTGEGAGGALKTERPARVQMSRRKPWKRAGMVCVARPTKWGNPIRWSNYVAPPAVARQLAVIEFRARLERGELAGYPSISEIQNKLAGQSLACWCPAEQPCHADVLLEIANANGRR